MVAAFDASIPRQNEDLLLGKSGIETRSTSLLSEYCLYGKSRTSVPRVDIRVELPNRISLLDWVIKIL